MASSEDYGKYFSALGSRSVRRVAAKVHAAATRPVKRRGSCRCVPLVWRHGTGNRW
jgi:hypothetical protein